MDDTDTYWIYDRINKNWLAQDYTWTPNRWHAGKFSYEDSRSIMRQNFNMAIGEWSNIRA